MTGSKDIEKPKAEIERVLAEFDGKKSVLESFAEKSKSLLEEFLEDAKIRYQSVQARVKDREKLMQKYLDQAENYKELNDITDQVALRIITYYEDEVDRVAKVIKKEFDVDPEKSVDKRETEPDKFGYYALNYVCKYLQGRTSQTEYKKFAGITCEIQIVSILRHAWSEIEHPWYDLKAAYPFDIKRRFARIAALLEIAESEFLNLKQIQLDYRRSIAVQVEANILDLQVDAVAMKSFIEREPLVKEIDLSMAAALGKTVAAEIPDRLAEVRSNAARLAGMTKLQDLRDALAKYRSAIPEYALRCRREVWPDAPTTPELTKGVCVYAVGLILVNIRGEQATLEYLDVYGVKQPDWDIARQITIGKEIAARYPR
jgi:GTP pyrophosphokinase